MFKKPATGLFLALFLGLFFQINSYPESLPTILLFPCDFYGEETSSGVLSAGAVVTAKDSQGNVIGQFTVTESGKYGLLTCKADDPLTPEDEGALDGETITFYVDGTQRGQATFQSGKTYRVNLPAGSPALPTQPPSSPVPPGWGWGSYPVPQPDPGSKLLFPDGAGLTLIALPLVPEDSNFDEVFTEYTQNSPKDFWEFVPSDTNDPWRHYHPWYKDYSDLTQMGMGKAYWIDKDTASDLWFFGDPFTDNITFNLKKGWNPIGWPYLYDKPVAQALSGLSFGTDCLYVARFNNLSQKFEYFSNSADADDFECFQPCRGYYIYMLKDKAVTVSNPGTSPREPSFSIDDTASYTSSASTVLTFSVANNLTTSGPDNSDKGIRRLLLSNDNSDWSEPLSYFYFNPYLRTTPWTLASGEGTKTVYARFLDQNDNIVALAQDSIILDTDNSGGSWPFNVNSYNNAVVKSSPAVADIDANNSLEVVFGTQEGSICCIDKNGQVVWRYDTGTNTGFSSSAALADLDGDNKLEVLIGRDISNNGSFYCLNSNGTLRWEYKAGSNIGFFSSAVAGDLDNDDTVEILTTAGSSVYCLNKNGGLNWKYDTGSAIYHSSPAIADIDGDNNLEVLAGSDNGYIYCLNKNGSLLWKYKTAGSIQTAPVIADLNSDGNIKVITGSGSHIYCLNKSGQLVWHYNIGNGFNISDFSVADINNDNKLEVLTACGYTLYCFNKDGGLLWPYTTGGWIFFGSPATADLDANGSLEVLISSADNALYCINGSGALVWKRERANVSSSFAIADLDGNNSLEVLFGTRYGNLCCLDKNGSDFVPSGSGAINALAWPMFQHDCQHTGLYDSTPPTIPAVTDEGETTESLTQLYASWTSSDEESSILKYEYKITEGSTSGAVVRDWTSTGTFNYVTAALNLTNGRAYFFGVKAKNNTLWSQVGYSDGITVKIYVDTTAPAISISSPANNSVTESSVISVSGTVDDNEAVVTVNGQLAILSGSSFSVNGISLSEGENTIIVTAVDKAGNSSMAFVKVTYEPNIPCAEPSIDAVDSPTNINRQVITGRKDIDVTEVNVSCSTATVGAVSFPTSLTWECELTNLSEGENTISVSAKNRCGNTSPVVTASITLDTIGPKLSLIANVIDEKTVEITYDSDVVGGSEDDNYSVSPSLGTVIVSYKEGNVYTLTTSEQSVVGINYTITVEGITDLLGNPIDPNSSSAVFIGTAFTSSALLMTFEADTGENRFGSSVASVGDINDDGYSDILVGVSNFPHSGKAYLYFGGPKMDNEADLVFTEGRNADLFGNSLASAGDVNADGFSDVIIGAPEAENDNFDFPFNETGKAYIYFGGASMDDVADVILSGEKLGERFGESVVSVGDLNGDGYSDVAVGISYEQSSLREKGKGRVNIYFGGPAMDDIADLIIEEEDSSYSVASAGDINNDGFSDIVVGMIHSKGPSIYFGGLKMDNVADFIISGNNEDSILGYLVSSCGDVNNDGFSDFAVGGSLGIASPDDDQGSWSGTVSDEADIDLGMIFVYFGGPEIDDVADVAIRKNRLNFDEESIACAGDVNNDGLSDIIIGVHQAGWYQCKAHIYLGGSENSPEADVDIVINSGSDCSAATAGDINGDGFDEVIVGASDSSGGKAYIYTLAPTLARLFSSARVIDDKNVEVSYSEEVVGADFAKNYSITPDLGSISVADMGSNIYRLTSSSSHTAGQTYTIEVSGVTDIGGGMLDPSHSQAVFVGYNSASVPSVDSFSAFDLKTGSAAYADSSTIGIATTESDPDGRLSMWLINESAEKPSAADFILTAKPVNYTITGPDGKRDIYAWVKDVDGNISELSDSSKAEITLDTTAPQIEIISPVDDSSFSSTSVDVSGSIDDITPVTVMVNGTEASVEDNEFTAEGIELEQGANIIIVSAEDSAGNSSFESITVVSDNTPASAPIIIDDGDFTMSLNELHANWSSADLESGITEYKYAIGTTAGGRDILDWTSAGTDTEVTRSDLSLKDGGIYYFTVKAINGAGLESEPGVSDGIELSLTMIKTWITYPEHDDFICDDLVAVQADVDANLEVDKLEFYLDDKLEYTAGEFPYEWEWVLLDTPIGTHVLKVSAYDVMGNVASNQIVVNVIELSASQSLRLAGATAIDNYTVEVSYTEEAFGALNPENYSISPSLGTITVSGEGSVYRLSTSLAQGPGEYYTVTVNNVTDIDGAPISEVCNKTGFYGYQSDKDNTAPSTPIVNDEGQRSPSNTTLYANWSCQDSESGIVEYQYAIGTTFSNGELDRNVLDWASVGTEIEITRENLNLSYDETYYIAVRAKNGAGLWSKQGVSDGITVVQSVIQFTDVSLSEGNITQEEQDLPVQAETDVSSPEDNTFQEDEDLSIQVETDDFEGEVVEYQFLIDGEVARSWSSSPNFTWDDSVVEPGLHTLQVQARSSNGRIGSTEEEIYIFRKAVKP